MVLLHYTSHAQCESIGHFCIQSMHLLAMLHMSQKALTKYDKVLSF